MGSQERGQVDLSAKHRHIMKQLFKEINCTSESEFSSCLFFFLKNRHKKTTSSSQKTGEINITLTTEITIKHWSVVSTNRDIQFDHI